METQQNTVNPIEQGNPTPEKKNKLYVVLGVVILILIAVAGYFLLPKAQKQNEQINSINWKSYSNSHYEIEFKYPSDMTVEESGTAIFVKSGSQNFVTIETNNINNVRNDNPWNANPGSKLETVRFAGANASVYTCPQNNTCPSGIIYSKAINLQSLPNDWRVGNVIFYDIKQGQEQHQALAESILSTIKFNFSNQIATWNLYTAPGEEFTFHYPENWRTNLAGKPDVLVYESEIQGSYGDGGGISKVKSTSASVELLNKFQPSDYEKCEKKVVEYFESYTCPYVYFGNYNGYDVFEKISRTVYFFYLNRKIALTLSASVPYEQYKFKSQQEAEQYLENKYNSVFNNVIGSFTFTQ